MANRQGSKVVENVTGIECMEESNNEGLQCRVVAESTIPTWYRNVEEVDTDNVKVKNQEVSENSYGFDEPVDCEIQFYEDYSRIQCEQEKDVEEEAMF